MSTHSASGVEFTGTGARVHGDGLADDQAIADQLADSLAGVGIGDFAHLIRIEPDLALTAADHGRRKALLGGEVDPVKKKISLGSPFQSIEKNVGAIEFIDLSTEMHRLKNRGQQFSS